MEYRVKTNDELIREFGSDWRHKHDLYWSSFGEKYLGTTIKTTGGIQKTYAGIKYVYELNTSWGLVLAILEEIPELEF